MTMLPEIIPSIGDIEKLGVEYSLTNPDANEYVMASFQIPTDSVRSFYVRTTMTSNPIGNFAQFYSSAVFQNIAGVVTRKNDADIIINRDNSDNFFTFVIVGDTVELHCKSGLAMTTNWSSMVAVI